MTPPQNRSRSEIIGVGFSTIEQNRSRSEIDLSKKSLQVEKAPTTQIKGQSEFALLE